MIYRGEGGGGGGVGLEGDRVDREEKDGRGWCRNLQEVVLHVPGLESLGFLQVHLVKELCIVEPQLPAGIEKLLNVVLRERREGMVGGGGGGG